MKVGTLGELEMQVMEILWQSKQGSVADVLKAVIKKKKIAYTTVATILERLYEKGIVAKKSDKDRNLYSPKLSKSAYTSILIKNFLSKIFISFGDVAIASFAENLDSLPKSKKEYLLQLLKTKSKK